MAHITAVSRLLVLACSLSAGFAWPQPASAQSAAIAGQVIDETGGVLPGATITLRDPRTGRERTAVSDTAGRFSIQALAAGPYALSVAMSGFEDLVRESVDAADGTTTTVSLVMKVSGLRDEVVVRGTARSVASSVAGKRAADGVVDMVSSDELGRLPDKNIGETLNRIPGVSMLLEKGEGRFIQIRGISPRLNNVTINGMSIGNAETEQGGRLLPLDMVGGELLSGVEVMKTPTPEMDGQGIGGTLNLTTKQPFDFANRFTAMVSSRGGVESIASIPPSDTKEVPYGLDVTLTGKSKSNKVGWLAGSSFSNRYTPLLGIYNDNWRTVNFSGQNVTYPTNVKNNVTVTGRERLNLNGALEFRPTGTSKYFARAFFAKWDEVQLRDRFDEGLGDNLTAATGPGSGTVASDRVQVNLRNETTVKKLNSVTFGGTNISGRWTLDYTAQRNQNLVDEPNDNWEFRSGASTFGPDTFVVDENGAVAITSPGRDRQDPSLQGFRRLRYFQQRTDESSYAGMVNLRRDIVFGGSKPGFLKAGVKFMQTKRETAVSQPSYGIGSTAWTLAQGQTFANARFDNPVPLRTVPNYWMDLTSLNAFFKTYQNDPRYFVLDQPATYMSEYQSDFDLRENVGGAYAMAKVDFGKWRLVGGLRVETTDVDSSAFTMVTKGTQLAATPIDGSGSYTNWLPSIVAVANLRRNLIARAAITTGLGRPEYDTLAPRSQLSIEDNPTIGTIGTLTIGNPDLQARYSLNTDASLEWYFDEGSLLSAAFFKKDISNEIIPAPTKRYDNYTYLGQTFNRFDVNTTINAETADIKGVEFTLSHRLRGLPSPLMGLGFSTSLTLIDSGVSVARGNEVLILPLLQQADTLTSATVYYQKGRFEASTTYKYNANFLTDYGDSRALDLDQGAFGRWDFRAQVDLAKDVKFFIDGINLNDEPTTEFQGGVPTQITEYEYTGTTFFMGFSARFGR